MLLHQPVRAGHLVTAYHRLVRPYFWLSLRSWYFQSGFHRVHSSGMCTVDFLLGHTPEYCIASLQNESTNHFEPCLSSASARTNTPRLQLPCCCVHSYMYSYYVVFKLLCSFTKMKVQYIFSGLLFETSQQMPLINFLQARMVLSQDKWALPRGTTFLYLGLQTRVLFSLRHIPSP